MESIKYLENEHQEILVFVNKLENECIEILNGKEINQYFFELSIKFIRKYADAAHHMKEEDILFKYMMENLGVPAEKLIKVGMMIEHQMGRYYIRELEIYLAKYKEEATDKNKIQIIANSMSYVNLLRSHIEKEDGAVYPFAERNLPEDIKKIIEDEMQERIKQEQSENGKEEMLIKILNM